MDPKVQATANKVLLIAGNPALSAERKNEATVRELAKLVHTNLLHFCHELRDVHLEHLEKHSEALGVGTD